MENIKWIENKLPKDGKPPLSIMSLKETEKARAFHRSFPQYKETPLSELKGLADFYGIKWLFVKDESYRFGLNAFKVLGGSYAIAHHISKVTGRPVETLTYDLLVSPELKKETGEITFFSATDGNHGRGIAWAAKRLGQRAVIMMPKGTEQSRFDNIRKEGAVTTIEDLNYDGCVYKAAKAAADTGGVLVQDTAWEGYEEIPSWIMQGYGTMAAEADSQFKAASGCAPTHIFVQAGVGSLAAAVTAYFTNAHPDSDIVFVIVEADKADCYYKSACAGDGRIRTAEGDMNTIMAGLACGEPSLTAWRILSDKASAFVSIPDWAAANGMRVLGAPIPGDPRVISGESGASTAGFLHSLMTDDSLAPLRKAIRINSESRVLLFSTEGDTDPDNYRRIVWDGAYAR